MPLTGGVGGVSTAALAGAVGAAELVTAGTYIDEAIPGLSPFPAVPRIGISYTATSINADQRWAIYRFGQTLTSVRSIIVPSTGPFANPEIQNDSVSGNTPFLIFTYRFELITADFNIATVTWATVPASSSFGRDQTIEFRPDSTNETGEARTSIDPSVLPGADVTGTFFGFILRPVSLTGNNIEDFQVPSTNLPDPATSSPAVIFSL